MGIYFLEKDEFSVKKLDREGNLIETNDSCTISNKLYCGIFTEDEEALIRASRKSKFLEQSCITRSSTKLIAYLDNIPVGIIVKRKQLMEITHQNNHLDYAKKRYVWAVLTEWFFVDEKYSGMGVGARLFQISEKRWVEKNNLLFISYVHNDNIASKKIMDKCGFSLLPENITIRPDYSSFNNNIFTKEY